MLATAAVTGKVSPHYSRGMNSAPSGLRLRPCRSRVSAQG